MNDSSQEALQALGATFMAPSSPVGVAIFDTEFRYTAVNERLAAFNGIPVEEHIGRTVTDVLGEDGKKVEDLFRTILATGRAVSDLNLSGPVPSRPGEVSDFNVSYFPIFGTDGETSGIGTVIFDNTARERAKAAMRRSDELQRAVYAAAENVAFVTTDLAGTESRVMGFSPGAETVFGYAANEIIGRKLAVLLPHTGAETFAALHQTLARGEKVFIGEVDSVRKSGEPFRALLTFHPHFDVVGDLIGAIGVAIDISQSKAMEAALRNSEQKMRSIFRASPVGIGLVSERIIVDVNERMCELLGYTKDEMVGNDARLVYFSDEEYERVGSEKYRQIQDTGTGTVETSLRHKDGRAVNVILNSTPLDRNDLSLGVTFTALDVSELVAAREHETQMEAQMRHVQKLESLGVLAGGIAHDFNNILMSVLGNADLALAEVSESSSARGYLDEIGVAAHRAADLCRQMLAYSGKGNFVIAPIDLSKIVDEMTHMMEVSISKKADLRCDFAVGLPPIKADATQIRQVVLNLITNASEALGNEEGVIRLTTRTGRFDDTVLNETTEGGEYPVGECVVLEVSDTGSGMDETTREKIFDPFFSTKFAGRGLGLAAVLGIVRGHGGAIEVESQADRGTTFRLMFPTATPECPAPLATDTALATYRGSGTVLLVDDEESVRMVGERMLQKLGFTVLTAENGAAAIEVYRRHRERIRCVVLDLTMPRMSGEEAYVALTRTDQDLLVLFSSGYGEGPFTRKFADSRRVGFIQKPYRTDELARALGNLLEQSPI